MEWKPSTTSGQVPFFFSVYGVSQEMMKKEKERDCKGTLAKCEWWLLKRGRAWQ
jgi:hypothetical protein